MAIPATSSNPFLNLLSPNGAANGVSTESPEQGFAALLSSLSFNHAPISVDLPEALSTKGLAVPENILRQLESTLSGALSSSKAIDGTSLSSSLKDSSSVLSMLNNPLTPRVATLFPASTSPSQSNPDIPQEDSLLLPSSASENIPEMPKATAPLEAFTPETELRTTHPQADLRTTYPKADALENRTTDPLLQVSTRLPAPQTIPYALQPAAQADNDAATLPTTSPAETLLSQLSPVTTSEVAEHIGANEKAVGKIKQDEEWSESNWVDVTNVLLTPDSVESAPVLASLSHLPPTGQPSSENKDADPTLALHPEASTPEGMLSLSPTIVPQSFHKTPIKNAKETSTTSIGESRPDSPVTLPIPLMSSANSEIQPLALDITPESLQQDKGSVSLEGSSAPILANASPSSSITQSNGLSSYSTAPSPSAEQTSFQSIQASVHDRNAWSKQLGEHVLWMSQQGQQTAELHLNPSHLGPMQITLSIGGNDQQTTANFVSQHAEVRQAIQDGLPQLREMFSSAGISLGQTSVNAQSQQQSQQQAFSSQNPQTFQRGGTDILGGPSVGTEAASSAIRTTSITQGRGLVDLFA